MAGLYEKDQVGKREDLADIVALVDVKECPFVSMVKKGSRPVNTLYSWQADKYADPQETGTVDGTDVATYENAAADRALLRNHIQVFRRTAKVSRLAEDAVVVAGVPSEIARAVAKKLVEIKRDMEATFLGDNDCQADDGTVPYLTRGMGTWIQTTAQTLYPVPSAYRPAAAQVDSTATASLTETDVQTLLKSIFDTTGMSGSYVLLAGSTLRRAFTDFTRTGYQAGASNAVAGRVRVFSGAMADKTVSATTTIFDGDFGRVEIVPSNYIGGATVDVDRGYVLDMDKIELRYSKRPKTESLPDLGGGQRRLIEACAGLRVANPIGLGKFQP